jgi:predicted nucleotidyltransferase
MTRETERSVVDLIRTTFPGVQAVYLYGSAAAGREGPDSDVDLGLLLPHTEAREAGSLALSDLRFSLEDLIRKTVDLVNLRRAPIVLQKEVIAEGRLLFAADQNSADEYEMYVLSFYGKLNEERAEILEEFARTKRAYPV